MASQARNTVAPSAYALGLGFNQWTRNDLKVILNHYRVPTTIKDSKNTLIDKLNQLAIERGLTREDRLAIVAAHKGGRHLPPRKPLSQGLITSITSRTTAIPLAITRPKENTSDAEDGDIEMSDREVAEELLTLSEEERDLREYTSTMTWPRSTATTAGNRLLRVNRRANANRSATVNSSASVRRSIPKPINRPGNATRSVSGHLFPSRPPSRPKRPALSTQPESERSASQITRAMSYECLICYNSFDLTETQMRQPTSACEHEVNICKSCLSASISSQLETKLWTRISCPASACDEVLGYDDVQQFAEPQTFARWVRAAYPVQNILFNPKIY